MPKPTATPTPSRRAGLWRDVGSIAWKTANSCFTFRVLGLAAETAFYALLSLPPLLFGLANARLFPLVPAGPDLIRHLLPSPLRFVVGFYWPVVLVGGIGLLTTMFHVAMPLRRRWLGDVPGALLAMTIWIGGSAILRGFLLRNLGSASLYGPLATPIALMLWLYLIAVATLVGAAFNAAIGAVWPTWSGLTTDEAGRVFADPAPSLPA